MASTRVGVSANGDVAGTMSTYVNRVSVEKARFTEALFHSGWSVVIRFFRFFRSGSCSCHRRGWLTAEESHQPFQVLRRGRQVELFAHEAHPAQP